jgi:GxxExxY protein
MFGMSVASAARDVPDARRSSAYSAASPPFMMKHEELTEKIIACVAEVHQALGPGFIESVYRNALVLQLRKAGLQVEPEKEVLVRYLGVEVGRHRLDLVVEGEVVVELKAVAELVAVHYEIRTAAIVPTGERDRGWPARQLRAGAVGCTTRGASHEIAMTLPPFPSLSSPFPLLAFLALS